MGGLGPFKNKGYLGSRYIYTSYTIRYYPFCGTFFLYFGIIFLMRVINHTIDGLLSFFGEGVFHKKHVRKLIITSVVSKKSSPSKLRKKNLQFNGKASKPVGEMAVLNKQNETQVKVEKSPTGCGAPGGGGLVTVTTSVFHALEK